MSRCDCVGSCEQGPLGDIADLIGTDMMMFTMTLLTNTIVTRGEFIVLKNTEAQAEDARDAIAKVRAI